MESGSDAFVQDWSEGFGFFHPPVALVPEVLDKVREDEVQGILVVPGWPGSIMAREIEYCKQLELVVSFCRESSGGA